MIWGLSCITSNEPRKMSDLAFSTYNDLYAARSIGLSLGRPTKHFVRVLRLVPIEGRLGLMRDAYESAKQLYKGHFSLEQFIAFTLFAWELGRETDDSLN